MLVPEPRAERAGPFPRRPIAPGERRDVGDGERLGDDVVDRGPASRGRLEHDPGHVADVDHTDRRLAPVVERQRPPLGREAAELVDHGLGLGPLVLDRARAVHDPQPQDGEPKPGSLGVHPQAELSVDLRQVDEVVLGSVGWSASTLRGEP